jgi:tetratricopeptide (TPR) repeat protein
MKQITYINLILLSIFILLNTNNLLAQHSHYEELNSLAINSYNNEDFEKSIEHYQSIEQMGIFSHEIYYNLGNCFFKVKNYPMAILYYERALKLKPNDNDTKYNLNIANQYITDKIEVLPELFFETWKREISFLFHTTTWSILSIVLSFLFAICFFIYYISKEIQLKKIFFVASIISIVFCFISYFAGNYQYNIYTNNKTAIIFASSVTVKSSPTENSGNLFVVHEGTKISILEELNGWLKIMLSDGNEGWIQQSTVERI